jgi:hypothetical protein
MSTTKSKYQIHPGTMRRVYLLPDGGRTVADVHVSSMDSRPRLPLTQVQNLSGGDSLPPPTAEVLEAWSRAIASTISRLADPRLNGVAIVLRPDGEPLLCFRALAVLAVHFSAEGAAGAPGGDLLDAEDLSRLASGLCHVECDLCGPFSGAQKKSARPAARVN